MTFHKPCQFCLGTGEALEQADSRGFVKTGFVSCSFCNGFGINILDPRKKSDELIAYEKKLDEALGFTDGRQRAV